MSSGPYAYWEITVGGNVFDHVQRLTLSEWRRTKADAIDIARAAGFHAAVPRPLAGKTDFGDVDVIVGVDDLRSDWQTRLISAAAAPFKAQAIWGPLSIALDEHQIDFIPVLDAAVDFAADFYAFGDSATFVCRTAERLGFLLQHTGLSLELAQEKNGAHASRRVLLTRDWDTVLKICGFDEHRYRDGLSDHSDVFDWLAGSELYQKATFTAPRNNEQRRRDLSRPMARDFRGWLYQAPPGNAELVIDSQLGVQRAAAELPRMSELINRAHTEIERELDFRARYNGLLVASWLDIPAPRIGAAMKAIERAAGSREELLARFIDRSDDELRAFAVEHGFPAIAEQQAQHPEFR